MAAHSGPISREEQVKEILKCGKDAVYFMRTYTKIQHAKRGLIPFETYPFQDDCVKAFEQHRFNIILKSRQLGLSTVTAAYAVWYAIFKKDKNILVIATKLQTAMNFIKKVRTMLDGLPKWLLLTKFEPTKQQISFSNGSTITAIPTSPDAGRSEALSLLIVDEAAFIRDFEDIWTGLYPTLSTGGSAIIISTPNGVGGMYYKLWMDGAAQVNEFNTINLPWWVHPEHDQAWFDKETKNLPKRKVAQEFLCDFISSGETFLQATEMDHLRSLIEQPIRKEGPTNGVWVWSDPEPAKKYVISSDVARGDGADFTTFHVIDAEECEVVVEYMGKIPPDKLADLLLEYGKRYNNALICPERNTFGYFTCVKLRDSGYKRLYYRNAMGDMWEYVPTNPDDVPGFETQGNTRPQILGKLEELIRNKIIKIYSQRFYDEMQGFVWNGAKAQASRDSHDDLIMSLAIGLWLTNGSSAINEQGREMALAMLKATKVERRDSSTMPGDINSAQPLVNPNIRGVNPYNVHKPRDAAQIRHGGAADFSWLLR
jgi:hypothetical protein